MKRSSFMSSAACAGGCAALWSPSRASAVPQPAIVNSGCGAGPLTSDMQTLAVARAHMGELVPLTAGLDVPAACNGDVSTLRQGFADSDDQDPTLLNRFVSFELGWVQVKECGCGGPPPICPADHWARDPDKAKKQRDDFIASQQTSRQNALEDAVCSCFNAQLAVPATSDSTGSILNGSQTPLADKFITQYQSATSLKDELDHIKGDNSLQQSLKLMAKLIPSLQILATHEVLVGSIYLLFESTAVGTTRDAYTASVDRLISTAEKVRRLRYELVAPALRSAAAGKVDLQLAELQLASALTNYGDASDAMSAGHVGLFRYCATGAAKQRQLVTDVVNRLLAA